MKKALDQTIRDLKREVNKKVLKVPGIEQKVLDATSNEPWGPHGSNLSDIAQATRNYHEYQLIMAVIWKRINDTGKNWRHVYKALTVLEYLVAHGSERVIDEIREHAYQISTLSDFQYIDSSGRDQGSNVRKKSQSLVILVNDKERISEVRQKAAVNRDKFRNASSTGGMYRPGAYSTTGGYGDRYDDDRNGSRDDDYGRERDYRDDDRYGRSGDSYSRDGDRYGRDSDDPYNRDGYRDGDYGGRSQSIDEYRYGSRSRSSDGYRERTADEDRYSSRSSGARGEDHSLDERRLERKFSEQNIGAPPTYEEAVIDAQSPVNHERDGEMAEAPAPKPSSPAGSTGQAVASDAVSTSTSPSNQQFDAFDEFDPRGPVSAPPPAASNGEMDLLGSLSESFSSNALALMPATSGTSTSEADAPNNTGSSPTFVALSSATTVLNQPIEDPFGDSPFKATPTMLDNNNTQNMDVRTSFQSAQSCEPVHPPTPAMETVTNFNFGDTFSGVTYTPATVQAPSTSSQLFSQEQSSVNRDTDILADILPPPGAVVSQTSFSGPQQSHGNFMSHSGAGSLQAPSIPPPRPNYDVVVSQTSQDSLTAPISVSANARATKKFEPKSTVWADTLSRGLVNFNISGPKTNPLADIGVDFDSINRKEKREKPPAAAAAAPVSSTISMGKAMGSGSGIGRAGAGALAPPNTANYGGMNQQSIGMGMGMGMGGGAGMNMANYGGMNQQQSIGMGMGMGMGMGGTGMMNMGGMGGQVRPGGGLPQNPNMLGNYNPMMGGQGGFPYGGYHR